MNSLFQELNQKNDLKEFIDTIKKSSNPQQLLLKYIQNNPQAQNMYLMLQNSNKTPKQLFYLMAQKKGVDPDSILKMLQ